MKISLDCLGVGFRVEREKNKIEFIFWTPNFSYLFHRAETTKLRFSSFNHKYYSTYLPWIWSFGLNEWLCWKLLLCIDSLCDSWRIAVSLTLVLALPSSLPLSLFPARLLFSPTPGMYIWLLCAFALKLVSFIFLYSGLWVVLHDLD